MKYLKSHRGLADIVSLLGITLFIVIGVSLMPTVGTLVIGAQENGTPGNVSENLTGAAWSLTGLVPLIFAALIIVGAVAFFATMR